MKSWRYALAALSIAVIGGVVSYLDGLFVVRYAGNTGWVAYLYPFLADGLIIICLMALVEGARMKVPRSRWAMFGLTLGIGLSVAMNVGAGIAHSVLDAVIDGMVPVVFFIAVEVVLWHVRRARPDATTNRDFLSQGRVVPSTVLEAAEASMAATTAAGNALSQNQLVTQFGLPRSEARTLWRKYQPKDSPAGIVTNQTLGPPAGANGNGAHG